LKLAIFSDVHGNLPALEAMVVDAGEVDGYICLGDLVNYGPWSDECVELAVGLRNCVYLNGNHEEAFATGEYPGSNPVVQAFFDRCYARFTRFDEISGLPTSFQLGGFEFRHTIQERYVYPDSEINLDANYVIGHSHHQFVIADSGHLLVNPGSVGQNRKYINIVNYATLETESMTFEGRALVHDIDLLIGEMRRLNYPETCLAYYEGKERWSAGSAVPGFDQFSVT